MTPKIWGPDFWMFFHLITFKYSKNPSKSEKIMAHELIESIAEILPCEKCKHHFKKNILNFPLNDKNINSREDFIFWFIDFHNLVNITLKKPLFLKNDILKINFDYWNCFKKVLSHIDHDNQNNFNFNKCQGLKKFIKVALYFGGKNINDYIIDFYDKKTFDIFIKNLLKQL